MDIGNIFQKKKEEPEVYWALVIGKTWVESAIWRVVEDRVEVLSVGATSSWEENSETSLVDACDSSLSAAAGSLEEDSPEPSKVVFGLLSDWVEEGQVHKEKLGILKNLSQKLELTPAGFVVVPEAIAHYLKSSEAGLVNSILVGISEDEIDLSLVRRGKLTGTTTVSRSMSLSSDIAEGLARFSDGLPYPSQILIYNHRTADLEEAKQSLIDANWEELDIDFLHTPKVEVLPEDISIKSAALAGGSEVGGAKRLVVLEQEIETGQKETMGSIPEETQAEGEVSEENVGEEAADKDEEGELEEVSPEEFGFLADKDIAEEEKSHVARQEGGGTLPQEPSLIDQREEFPKEGFGEQAKSRLPVSTVMASAKSLITRIPRPRRLSFWEFGTPQSSRVGVVALVLLVLLFLAGGISYWFLPKAQVTIYVAPKTLEKDLEIVVDPKASETDSEKKILPGRQVDVAVSGERTTEASGTKRVGERAKGVVTIFHVGGATKLSEGSILTGPNDLRFTLNEDVLIASASSITNPSKTDASVTASDIGAEFNLSSGSEFSVGNFSKTDFVAQNSESLSGGTSREVSAVSEKDHEQLRESLFEELKNKGAAQIKEQLSPDEVLIEESVVFLAQESSFSHKVGEETQTVKLSSNGKVGALVASKEKLDALLLAELEREVPEGFALKASQIETRYNLKTEEEEEGQRKFSVHVVANLLPKVQPVEIASKIKGKYPTVAKEFLSTIPGFTRSSIVLRPNLPGKLGTLPRVAKNITIEVAAEK